MRFMCVSVYARTCFYFYMKILTYDLIIYKLFYLTLLTICLYSFYVYGMV